MPAHPRRRPGLRRDALLPIHRRQTRSPPLRRPHRTDQRKRLDPGDHLNSHAARAAFPLSRELWRILRAALWSSLHFGFEGTLGQIVDLVENGWVLDANAALAIMKLLLLARSHVDSELEMVDRLIADGAPGDDEAWKTSQPGDW